ncbi:MULTISPECIES: enoyl-CoA hydratase-related protein [unclassified Saccharicrinis]|uniref:enoyl-CoA hydratase-related protein n=1 Tax=unclassified Saccharicrinis TaxID=2646859 RepID=UPI003D345FBD
METIKFYIENGIAFLGLNRPEKKNAINKRMIEEIIQTLNKNKANRIFRVLVIYGEGDHFCSGADLEWMKEGIKQSKTENINDAKLFNTLFETIHTFPTPVICEVRKSAFGGAVGLMACSDIVLCEPDSTFGFPEVKLGIIPATIAPYIISKMGGSNARKRLLIPNPFSAKEAQAEALVHFIADGKTIRKKTLSIAQAVAQGAPDALIQTKALILRLEESEDDESALLFCARLIANARISKEGQEGVKAFFEKRKPAWNNEENIPSV